MADYIVQKPIDLTKLTAKARNQLPPVFDITPKYDGCCAVLAFDAMGRFFGAFSATGEEVRSMDHIGAYLAQRWTLRGVALIGEAWIEGEDFPVINGTFRRHTLQPQLRFVPFDASRWALLPDGTPELCDPRPYHERIEVLLHGYDPLYVIPLTHWTGDLADAERIAKEMKARGGFDGAIARDANAPYFVGRCKFEAIKVKPVLSLDLLVVGWKLEPGEKTGRMVPSLQVVYQGVASWVGSGIPHDLKGLPNDPRDLIVEVECMGVTPDGKLREPRFKGIRYDKAEAD